MKRYRIIATMEESIYPAPPDPEWKPVAEGALIYVYSNGTEASGEASIANEHNFFDVPQRRILDSLNSGLEFIDPSGSLFPLNAPSPPRNSNKTVVFDIVGLMDTNNVTYLSFNSKLFYHDMSESIIGIVLNKRSLETLKSAGGLTFSHNAYNIEEGDIVDVVFNNYDPGEHPLHLHGHNFWVMYQGKANTNNLTDPYNETVPYSEHAMIRDSATINPAAALVIRLLLIILEFG